LVHRNREVGRDVRLRASTRNVTGAATAFPVSLTRMSLDSGRKARTCACVCIYMCCITACLSGADAQARRLLFGDFGNRRVLKECVFSRRACNATAPRTLTACLSGAATALRRLREPRGQARLLRDAGTLNSFLLDHFSIVESAGFNFTRF